MIDQALVRLLLRVHDVHILDSLSKLVEERGGGVEVRKTNKRGRERGKEGGRERGRGREEGREGEGGREGGGGSEGERQGGGGRKGRKCIYISTHTDKQIWKAQLDGYVVV